MLFENSEQFLNNLYPYDYFLKKPLSVTEMKTMDAFTKLFYER